jgi:hypothetical protein
MARRIRVEEHAKRAAMKDIEVLAAAVRRFLFDVYKAGKIVMPPDVANVHRELKRRVDEALTEPCGEHPVDSRGVSMLLKWSVELEEIRLRYPPPRVSREIRELMQTRAFRMQRGADVSVEWMRWSGQISRRHASGHVCNRDKERSMQRANVERITIVHEIVCDHCGARAFRTGKGNYKQMTSIGFSAQELSIFGRGQRVEIDLCEQYLRTARGKWLRVAASSSICCSAPPD